MSFKDVPIASQAFPGLPIFLRRQFNWTSLVRLSDPCVSGGSTTAAILPQAIACGTSLQRILATEIRSCKAVLEGRGFYTNFR